LAAKELLRYTEVTTAKLDRSENYIQTIPICCIIAKGIYINYQYAQAVVDKQRSDIVRLVEKPRLLSQRLS